MRALLRCAVTCLTPSDDIAVKSQIKWVRCRPQIGVYLGLSELEHPVSFGRVKGLEAWPWRTDSQRVSASLM